MHLLTVSYPKGAEHPEYLFRCTDPNAECHTYPDCDCERWEKNHPHPATYHEKCWMANWFGPAMKGYGPYYEGEGWTDENEFGLPEGFSGSGTICITPDQDVLLWEFETNTTTERT